jgi:hypothetical protein
MKLRDYQRLAAFWNDGDDQVSQVAWIIMDVYSLTYDEVNNMEPKRFLKYSKRIGKQFSNIDKKPFYSWFKFETDASKITLGQFIEVQHFMKQGQVDAMHLVGASIWKDKRDHKLKSELLLNTNIRHVLQDITRFFLSFAEFINSYKGLFETDEPEEDEYDELAKPEKPHPFVDQYGWFFSAKQVAEYEGITLAQAFDLPIIQALNDLSYLKAFQSYQKHINK